jgi:hypothetical protein
MSCKDDLKRSMPGRLVGVSVDARGNKAYRLALRASSRGGGLTCKPQNPVSANPSI